MTPALRDAFEDQAAACAALGSPFMERALPMMLDAVSGVPAVVAALTAIPPDRLAQSADATALRLAAGFHRIVLQGHALKSAYPPNPLNSDALFQALSQAAQDAPDVLVQSLKTPPQTNEIRRSAVLIALGHWLTARYGKMLILSELGCSAGLNLNWDFYQMTAAGQRFGPQSSPVHLTPEWRGNAPTLCPAYVHQARGIDLNPPNIFTDHGRLALLSYIWPDQPERMALTQAGLDIAQSPDSESTDQVITGDAVDWLASRVQPQAPYLHLVYSTVAWQYLPTEAQERGKQILEHAGQTATDDAPLAWFRMEADNTPGSAALTLHIWPENQTIPMGRADFHGRWVDWQAPAS